MADIILSYLTHFGSWIRIKDISYGDTKPLLAAV